MWMSGELDHAESGIAACSLHHWQSVSVKGLLQVASVP
jgi:hypothetical protein